MWKVVVLLIVANALQFLFFNKQMKKFNDLLAELRTRGNVLVGKHSGAFKKGSIVIFLLHEDQVKESYCINGRTVFNAPKRMSEWDGYNIKHLAFSEASLQKAYANALENYHL